MFKTSDRVKTGLESSKQHTSCHGDDEGCTASRHCPLCRFAAGARPCRRRSDHVWALWAAYPNLSGGVEDGQSRLLTNNGGGHSPLLSEPLPLADLIPGFDMLTIVGAYSRAGTP